MKVTVAVAPSVTADGPGHIVALTLFVSATDEEMFTTATAASFVQTQE